MICYENESTDPAYNMAVEEALLINAGQEPLLLLHEYLRLILLVKTLRFELLLLAQFFQLGRPL